MSKINIKKLSIQSLQAFDALYQTNNVTRAAKHINITQAAMSNILKQLREVFDDPLFIRQSKGILPTNLAHEIAPKIEQAIRSIECVLTDEKINPVTYFDIINIAMSDYGEYLLLPSLYKTISQYNSNIQINIKRFYEKIDIMDFRRGDILLALGIIKEPSKELCSKHLFEEKVICVMNKHHPLAKQRLTLKQYQQEKHIAFMPYDNSKQSFIDDVLAGISIKRKISVTTTHLTTALNLIEKFPIIGTLPEKLCLATGLDKHSKLIVKKPPFYVPPCNVSLFWHKNNNHHPAHIWLRKLVMDVILAKNK